MDTIIVNNIIREVKSDSVFISKDDGKLIEAFEAFSNRHIEAIEDVNLTLLKHFGENNSLWGVFSYDTLLIAIITLFLFLMGYIVNHFYKKWQKHSEAKSIRNHILTWMALHDEVFKRQIENFQAISEKLVQSSDIQEEQLIVQNFQINKLLEISFLKLMNIYVNNSIGNRDKNEKAFFNLINSLEFISSSKDRVTKKYNEFTIGTDEIRESWNRVYIEFENFKTDLKREYNQVPDPITYGLIEDLNNFDFKFFSSKSVKIGTEPIFKTKEWIEDYFVPLRDVCIKHNMKYPANQNVYALLKKIEGILLVYKRWVAWKDGYSLIFEDFKSHTEKSSENIKIQIGHFEENYLVFWLWFSDPQN